MARKAAALILSIIMCFNNAFPAVFAEENPDTGETTDTITEPDEVNEESSEVIEPEDITVMDEPEETVTEVEDEENEVPAGDTAVTEVTEPEESEDLPADESGNEEPEIIADPEDNAEPVVAETVEPDPGTSEPEIVSEGDVLESDEVSDEESETVSAALINDEEVTFSDTVEFETEEEDAELREEDEDAEEILGAGETAQDPVIIVFNKTYSKTWPAYTNNKNCFNRFTLTEQGIVSFKVDKIYNGGYSMIDFYLYDNSNNLIWCSGTHDSQDNISSQYIMNVGLAKGNYILNIKYSGYSSQTASTKYSISFNQRKNCESESNGSFVTADEMNLSSTYLGYLGAEYVSNYDEYDCWKAKLQVDGLYGIYINNYEALEKSSMILNMINPGNDVFDLEAFGNYGLMNQVTEQGYHYVDFYALYNGTYFIRMWNYHGSQIPYEIGIIDYLKYWNLNCEWWAPNGYAFWYENGVRQGTYEDPNGVVGDGTIRGREIYDGASGGWYWLDSVYSGAKAVGKEVWMPYIYQDEDKWTYEQKVKLANESDPGMEACVLNAMLNKDGKWVRYDENGAMLKGWVTISGALAQLYPGQAGNTYYYDTRTGLMARGWVTIQGQTHHFDEQTGRMLS